MTEIVTVTLISFLLSPATSSTFNTGCVGMDGTSTNIRRSTQTLIGSKRSRRVVASVKHDHDPSLNSLPQPPPPQFPPTTSRPPVQTSYIPHSSPELPPTFPSSEPDFGLDLDFGRESSPLVVDEPLNPIKRVRVRITFFSIISDLLILISRYLRTIHGFLFVKRFSTNYSSWMVLASTPKK